MTRIGVAGLGTMGAGIVQVCLEAGLSAIGWDIDDSALVRGRAALVNQLERKVMKGKLTEADQHDAIGRLQLTTDLSDLASCSFVIEAIVEDIRAKRVLFRELDSIVPPPGVLASNTSALSLTEIASGLNYPDRVVGMHFFNPVPTLPLVEVIRAEQSSAAAVAAAEELSRKIGKEPIVCGDTPGFVVNRLLIPVLNEAVRALDEGVATAEAIDVAMRHGAGWPIGPLALIDLIGVDTYVRVCDALWDSLHETRFAASPRLARMVNAQLLGRKTRRGFYDYRNEIA